jgi:hypothetical protein
MLTPAPALRPNYRCRALIRWLRHLIACAKISAQQEIQRPFVLTTRFGGDCL